MYQLSFLLLAYLVSNLLGPDTCLVRSAWPFPYAACPGMDWGPEVELLLSLPGALLAFPLILPQISLSANAGFQLYIAVPFVIHVLAWSYVIVRAFRWVRSRD